jgi:hypothetical protein
MIPRLLQGADVFLSRLDGDLLHSLATGLSDSLASFVRTLERSHLNFASSPSLLTLLLSLIDAIHGRVMFAARMCAEAVASPQNSCYRSRLSMRPLKAAKSYRFRVVLIASRPAST